MGSFNALQYVLIIGQFYVRAKARHPNNICDGQIMAPQDDRGIRQPGCRWGRISLKIKQFKFL
jgi:hypothetical protein